MAYTEFESQLGQLVHRDGVSGMDEFFEGMPVGFHPDFIRKDFDFMVIGNDYETTKVFEAILDAANTAALAANTQGGGLLISSQATTDDEGGLVQTTSEPFGPGASADKKFWAEVRVTTSTANDQDFFFGLADTAATDPEAILAVDNRIGFQRDDGDASWHAVSEKAAAQTKIDCQSDAVAATEVILGIKYNGSDTLEFYVNRNKVASITENIPVLNMGLAMFHLSGSASGTITSLWRRLYIVQEI